MTDDDGSGDGPAPDPAGSPTRDGHDGERDRDAESPVSEHPVDDQAPVDQAVRADTADDDDGTDGQPDREALLTEVRTIDVRIRWKWLLRVLLTATVFGVLVGTVSVLGLEGGVLPGVGAFGVATLLGVVYVVLLYRTWRYEIRADALYLERGVFTHVKTVVPFVRVQHIDTSRDPIDRALGLSSLVVYTAGSRGADVTVPGLTPDEAADLQDRLKLLAKDSTGDDAV